MAPRPRTLFIAGAVVGPLVICAFYNLVTNAVVAALILSAGRPEAVFQPAATAVASAVALVIAVWWLAHIGAFNGTVLGRFFRG